MRLGFLPLALLVFSSCGKDSEDGGSDTGDTSTGPPTYYTDIAPILSENCSMCHSPDGIQPNLLFDDPEATSILSGTINNAVQDGRMPPFFAVESEECENPWGFVDDPRLSQEQMDLLAEWADAGGPIGNIEDAVSLPEPRVGKLDDADVEIFPPGKHTTAVVGDTEDEFICFSLDPGLTEQAWLDGFAVLPEDLGVVHHVLMGIDHEGDSADIVDENGTYPCFGGFGDISATFVGGWIPGSSPIEFPDYSAVRMEAGSRILLQIHYHLVDEERQDGTGVALRFADQHPVQPALLTLIGNAGEQNAETGDGLQPGENDEGEEAVFLIPANAEAHTETMRYHPWSYAPRNVLTFLLANHMHYIGQDMKVWVERGEEAPDEEDICLLHTPEWDFDWQQFYKYDASSGNAPRTYKDDTLFLECVYNNSMSNPAAKKAIEEAGLPGPIDVSLGNGTLDEMCIIIAGWVYDVPVGVPDASHEGVNSVTLTLSGGATTDCEGPAGFSIGENGTIEGISACGLDLGGQLLTLEYDFSGQVNTSGEASGTGTIEVLFLEGDQAPINWTGTLEGDELNIEFQGSGVFSNNDVDFNGSLALSSQD